MLFYCPCGPEDTANSFSHETSLALLSQDCSKVRFETYIHGEDVLQQHTPDADV